MDELPEAFVAHRSPARLRLRIPARRQDADYLERTGKQLASALGVDAVEINPLTGSILLQSGDLTGVTRLGEERQLFRLVQRQRTLARRKPGPPRRPRARGAGRRNGTRSALGFGLAGIGLVQLARGDILAPAATLWWYAGELLHLWGGSEQLRDFESVVEAQSSPDQKTQP